MSPGSCNSGAAIVTGTGMERWHGSGAEDGLDGQEDGPRGSKSHGSVTYDERWQRMRRQGVGSTYHAPTHTYTDFVLFGW